jgi:hypothetical protein
MLAIGAPALKIRGPYRGEFIEEKGNPYNFRGKL